MRKFYNVFTNYRKDKLKNYYTGGLGGKIPQGPFAITIVNMSNVYEPNLEYNTYNLSNVTQQIGLFQENNPNNVGNKIGYAFNTFTVNKNGVTWVNNNIVINANTFGNITVVQTWTPIEYNLTYNNGTSANYPVTGNIFPMPNSYNIESIINFDGLNLSRPGYSFVNVGPNIINNVGDKEISVNWMGNQYNIVILNQGTGASNGTYTINDNDINVSTNPGEKEDLVFAGYTNARWVGPNNGGTIFTSGNFVSFNAGGYGDIEVEATWEEDAKKYLLFESNDGDFAPIIEYNNQRTNLQWSHDGTTWTYFASNAPISSSNGKLYIRGNTTNYTHMGTIDGIRVYNLNNPLKLINVSGDLGMLYQYANFNGYNKSTHVTDSAFRRMFQNQLSICSIPKFPTAHTYEQYSFLGIYQNTSIHTINQNLVINRINGLYTLADAFRDTKSLGTVNFTINVNQCINRQTSVFEGSSIINGFTFIINECIYSESWSQFTAFFANAKSLTGATFIINKISYSGGGLNDGTFGDSFLLNTNNITSFNLSYPSGLGSGFYNNSFNNTFNRQSGSIVRTLYLNNMNSSELGDKKYNWTVVEV